jgi:hypothetical protein
MTQSPARTTGVYGPTGAAALDLVDEAVFFDVVFAGFFAVAMDRSYVRGKPKIILPEMIFTDVILMIWVYTNVIFTTLINH